jgi:hypothetical protein
VETPVSATLLNPEGELNFLLFEPNFTTAARVASAVNNRFCKLGLGGNVPDHSTFSKNRHGRFRESGLLRHVFEMVLRRCIESGLVAADERRPRPERRKTTAAEPKPSSDRAFSTLSPHSGPRQPYKKSIFGVDFRCDWSVHCLAEGAPMSRRNKRKSERKTERTPLSSPNAPRFSGAYARAGAVSARREPSGNSPNTPRDTHVRQGICSCA